MSTKGEIAIAIVEKLIDGPAGKFLCGEYEDGTTRSIPDAIRGENKSPEQKRKKKKKSKKKKDKKKKKHNKKKKSSLMYW